MWRQTRNDQQVLAHAKAHLQRAQQEAAAGPEPEKDSTLYVARFLLAILMVDQQDYLGAAREIAMLSEKIAQARRAHQGNAELEQYWASIEPSVLAMQAGLLAHHGQAEAQEFFARAESLCATAADSDLTHYNLACAYAMSAAGTSEHAQKTNDTEKAFDHLARAFWLKRTRTADARHDRCLQGLRTGAHAQRFQALVQKYASDDTRTTLEGALQFPLAELRLIGQPYAEQLNQLGIATWAQLRHHTWGAAQQAHLAYALDIRSDLVQRWAALADLLRIEGIGPREANLLSDAQVTCLQQLATRQSVELAALLSEIATATNSGMTIEREAVRRWVHDARALQAQQHAKQLYDTLPLERVMRCTCP